MQLKYQIECEEAMDYKLCYRRCGSATLDIRYIAQIVTADHIYINIYSSQPHAPHGLVSHFNDISSSGAVKCLRVTIINLSWCVTVYLNYWCRKACAQKSGLVPRLDGWLLVELQCS